MGLELDLFNEISCYTLVIRNIDNYPCPKAHD